MKKLALLFALVFTVVFSGCESKNDEISEEMFAKPQEAKKKYEPQNFKMLTVDGKNINFNVSDDGLKVEGYEGKILLVNFFATWCPPCLEELPAFVKIQEKYRSQNFEIIAVLYEKPDDITNDEVKAFMKKYNMNFMVTVGEENFGLAKAFGDVKKIPESFLFSPDGTFLKKYVGKAEEKELIADIESTIKHNQNTTK